MSVLIVSSNTKAVALAGAVAGAIREEGFVEVQGIGAAAVNVAVKAVAIARGYVSPEGINLVCTPAFIDVVVNDKELTAVKLIVEPSRWGSFSASGEAKHAVV